MKSFLVGLFIIVALCAGVLADTEVEEKKQQCLKENKITEAELTAAVDGKMAPADVKENLKCFFRCFMVKEGFIDGDGKINEAAILAKNPNQDKKPVEAALQKCKGIKDPNPCEMAFKMALCMMKDVKMYRH